MRNAAAGSMNQRASQLRYTVSRCHTAASGRAFGSDVSARSIICVPWHRTCHLLHLSPMEGFAQLISDDSIVTNDSGGFGDGGTGGWSAGLGGRVGVGASGPDAG